MLEVRDGGLEVQVGDDGATGFIKRTDLGRDRDEQRPERFQVGQKFDALVIGFDRSKKPNFSIKALQIAEEKQAVAQYGSSDSGASLGDILGEALKQKTRLIPIAAGAPRRARRPFVRHAYHVLNCSDFLAFAPRYCIFVDIGATVTWRSVSRRGLATSAGDSGDHVSR